MPTYLMGIDLSLLQKGVEQALLGRSMWMSNRVGVSALIDFYALDNAMDAISLR